MKKKENFIYDKFLVGLKYIGDSKKFIYFAGILFFAFGVFGFLFPVFFKEQIFELIEGLLEMVESKNFFELFIFILNNNAFVSLATLFLGIFLGFFPIINMVANGYLVGFVASKSVEVEGIFSLWRLLPHGIFEIPAILISAGLGIRLGFDSIFSKKRFKELFLKSIFSFIFVVLPLLCIAGIIESIFIYFLK